MIRTAATLFAKKTAIVAISGVVVIGGAGLALAAEGDGEETGDTTTTIVDDTTTTTETSVPDTTTTTEPESTTTTAPESTTTTTVGDDAPRTAEAGDEVEPAEHPDNHGKVVSAAAHGEEGSGCEGRTGRDKGQCVSAIARGEEPPVLEPPAPTAAPTDDAEGETADDSSDEADTMTAEQTAPAKSTGKPAHAGKGGKK